ncbi:MAG TPA: MFS transporter [Gaiellaceae bacterium]|nr:MFS transporter [Gaiellaceae bacterium]
MAPPGYRWVVLAAGTFAQTSFAAVAVALPALAPALRADYGLSLGAVGIVLGATSIGMLFTLLPWGFLADRLGERLVIVVGLGGAAAALAGTAETRTVGPLVALLVATGALGASVNSASGRAVMAWFDSRERGLALGIRQTANPLGGAAGAVSLPWLATAGGTRLAFLVLAGTCLAGALVGGALLRETSRTPPIVVDAAHPLKDPAMWRLAGGSSFYLVGQYAITNFVVLFLHQHRGLSAPAAAAVLAAVNVLGVGARIVVGRFSDRRALRIAPMIAIGLVLATTLVAVAALVDTPLALLVPVLIVCGVIGLAWNGLSFTAAAETVGLARSGAALGFQQTMLGVAAAVVPPVFAATVDAASWRLAFALAAVGPLLGVALLRGVPEATGRRSARTPGTSASLPAVPRTPD